MKKGFYIRRTETKPATWLKAAEYEREYIPCSIIGSRTVTYHGSVPNIELFLIEVDGKHVEVRQEEVYLEI